jgi:hypothetical protein
MKSPAKNLFFFPLFLLFLGACSAGNSMERAAYARDTSSMTAPMAAPQAVSAVMSKAVGAGGSVMEEQASQGYSGGFIPGQAVGEEGGAGKPRKLIQSAILRLRVDDPEKAEKPVMEALDKYGAYAASSNIHENSRNYTVRVPADSYKDLLADFNNMGRLLYRSEHAEDVSLRYYDLDGRLRTKRELLNTFQNYLRNARNIEEIMTVETRIAELQNEIDWLGTELTGLSDQVDYATINLELLGPSSSSRSDPGLGERLADLFRSFGDYASTVLVVLAGIAIYGIPGILILALLFLLLFGRIGLIRKLFRLAAGRR